MKKFIDTIKTKANKTKCKLAMSIANAGAELTDETGANHHTDVSIWMIIGCTVGGLLLGAIITLITTVVMPGITDAIQDLFAVN